MDTWRKRKVKADNKNDEANEGWKASSWFSEESSNENVKEFRLK